MKELAFQVRNLILTTHTDPLSLSVSLSLSRIHTTIPPYEAYLAKSPQMQNR